MKKTRLSLSSKSSAGSFTGAAFLMATSAVGPGFITQTTVFSQQLFTSFGFVILLSIIIDLLVQLNIWRIVGVAKMPAPEIANRVFPGLGLLLVLLVSAGGLVFNIGNIGGCGLALNTLFGWHVATGAILSCIVAVIIFLNKEFGKSLDLFTKLLGLLMIALMFYTAVKSQPPLIDMLYHSFIPTAFSSVAVITLVGGTVGGYISFAGAHRMLDAAAGEPISLQQINAAAIRGIALASLMRVLLFACCIGVIAMGVKLPAGNPAAAVFQTSAGIIGLKFFGIVLWSAAITSVVGAAYTSVSFLQSLHPVITTYKRWFIIGFIMLSTTVFTIIGNPVNVLVKAGAINGFVLPVALAVMLLACHKKKLLQNYTHPLWLSVAGWIVVAALGFMSISVFTGQ